jgi:hypothetical protein
LQASLLLHPSHRHSYDGTPAAPSVAPGHSS